MPFEVVSEISNIEINENQAIFGLIMAMNQTRTKTSPRFALCIKNKGCDDLITRKIYRVLPDATAKKENHFRVVDESGEDYLYPANYFVMLELPEAARRIFVATRRRTTVAA